MSELVKRPEPTANAMSQPYWDAAAQGRLILQTCGECGAIRHYPRLLCDRCYSDQVVWTDATGNGVVHSWTVAHHPFHGAFADELPYTLVTITLDEGPRALGRWRGDGPRLEQRVSGKFETRADGSLELVFVGAD